MCSRKVGAADTNCRRARRAGALLCEPSHRSGHHVAASNRSTRRRRHDRALWLAGLVTFSLIGCKHTPRQAMSDLWDAVPQVRWSGSRTDPTAEPVKAEPSVTANVATTAEPTQGVVPVDPESGQSSFVAADDDLMAPEFDSIQTVSGSSQQEASTSSSGVATANIGQPNDDAGAGSAPQDVFADSSVDQIERLKAALSDDAERAKSPPRQAGGAHDVRVRVESMLTRARRLFDLGQLREARHAAKVAHDLGDSARLDYSPDEERPIDLVQRIDSQLKESAGQNESNSAQTANSSDNPPASNTNSTQAGRAAQDDPRAVKEPETDSAPRPKRDWGLNVFRRDRKMPPTDQATATPSAPVGQAKGSAVPTVIQMSFEADTDSPEESGAAVVQANRSLTLIKASKTFETSETRAARIPRQSFDSSTPIAYAPFQRTARDGESSEALLDTSDPDLEVRPSSEIESDPPPWPLDVDESPTRPIVDESTPPPADVEEVKPLSPFHDVAGQSSPDIAASVPTDNLNSANWNWLAGIAAFGICALIAVFWYRRGAT